MDFTYGEARTWIEELGRETGSHLVAEMSGFVRAATHAEIATVLQAEATLNRYRNTKAVPEPIELPLPWRRHDNNEDLTPQMRADLELRLNAVSAFPD
ncbi:MULTISPECIES: hypothetical protein [Microbacterium]|uniref:hypothetical protein n=1 Tax=Microbacterium TaxID=33882 RepID=UPI000DD1240F|nr:MULTISPECIES: hypothetical protein [Microbacterium]AXA95464.1 hypothetical protein CEP17_02975 [Microbacterium sp. PM5]QOC26041.1 hypothetical protein IC745_01030 [Microbacterium hominis]QOC30012.1 hypothetical protein IC744_06710 [Microbacterium hominis]QYF98448.1 hypothetical protein KY498_04175 [Microbacterium sp. PAMC21962]